MSEIVSAFGTLLARVGIALLVANEIRGIVLAAPVFYGMYEAGGTVAAIWLGVCSLAGVALSVVVPVLIAKKFEIL